MNKVALKLRRWYIAGLIVFVPVFVTVAAIKWVYETLDAALRPGVDAAATALTGAPLHIPGIGFVVVILLIPVLGGLASNLVGRTVLGWFDKTLDRIPLVRTLYGAIKQLIAPFGAESNPFQQVVMVEMPGPDVYTLGFLIKPNAATSASGEPLSVVLCPTNHVYFGHVGLYPARRIHHVDMNADEALRFLVSMGNALDSKVALGPPPATLTAAQKK